MFEKLMLLPHLLLQKTSNKSSSTENKKTLERRLDLWNTNKIADLLGEGLVIQSRLNQHKGNKVNDLGKSFQNLMIKGNVNGALRLLSISNSNSNGILPLTEDTMEELRMKHPEANSLNDDLLLNGPMQLVNSVIFDAINEESILKACVKTKGAAGVSGLDADEWRRIMGSKIYGSASVDLRNAVARMARSICSTDVKDPDSLEDHR